MTMWTIEATEEFQHDAERFETKRKREYLAVMHNLEKLLKILNETNEFSRIGCSFLSPEGNGLFRISEIGGGSSLQPTRLYVQIKVVGKTVVLLRLHTKGSPSKQTSQINRIKEQIQKTS